MKAKGKNEIRICCRACGGAGTIELPTEYAQTLAFVRRWPKNGVDSELAAGALGTKQTAQSMRLKRLLGMGLITRKRDGKWWTYYPAPPDGQ